MNNLALWDSVKQPPNEALRAIMGGRLRGKTDINPQWRIKALTEHFGICGIGWYYDIVKLWTEEGSDGQKLAFAEVKLYVKVSGEWSKGISGVGGNMMIEKESKGLYSSDECYKMAITDALSVCCKNLGFGADIYMGLFDGSKYREKTKEIVKEKKLPSAWTGYIGYLRKWDDFYIDDLLKKLDIVQAGNDNYEFVIDVITSCQSILEKNNIPAKKYNEWEKTR